MSEQEIYDAMVQNKGWPYRPDQIVRHSFYNDPIDQSPGRLAGNSHIHGDASPEVQSRAIDALIRASERGGLNAHETAYVLAIARAESGFNPDAAAGTTSAYGLGQFVKDTGAAYGIDDTNRYDTTKQAEALVVHYKENAALARARGQDESYIYKYHHDGPSGEYGGLELANKHVIPYIASYEKFVQDHQRKHGVEPLDPNLDARNHATPTRNGNNHTSRSIRQGDVGERVGALQTQLREAGYTNLDGTPLSIDKNFGPSTKAAIEAFQRDHSLQPDGIAGPATLAAMSQAKAEAQTQAPSLLDAQHPAHGMYQQAYQCVARLDEERGLTPGPHTQMFAGSLTTAALGAGMSRIDHVVLSEDASRGFAVQGALNSPFKQYADVNVMEAIQTPLDQSSKQAAEQMNAVPKAPPMNQNLAPQQQVTGPSL